MLRAWSCLASRPSDPPWAKDSLISASALRGRDIAVSFRELLDTPEPSGCPHPSVQDPGSQEEEALPRFTYPS